ncbi:MAG: hypothetical protein JSW00_13100 [Thermoplasmata archaeon]|nr:MAG: hypothetical protein JSW00_13100 [Thermoplasmata archaeon]
MTSMIEERINNLKVISIAILYVFIFILVAMILLTIFGIIRFSLGFGLAFFISVISLAIWGRLKRAERMKEDQLELQRKAQYELKNLPKTYNFYCPRCLHQTNDDVKTCPDCGVGRLMPTARFSEDEKIGKNVSKHNLY